MSETPRLNRRLLILRVATIGAAATIVSADAGAQGSKGGRGTGLTDSDPNDGAGNGRGGSRPRTGVTDNDPNDGAGSGRGGFRPRTGVTDNDPNDGAGSGRGGYRGRTVTDSDPSDGAGRGRGYR